MPQYVLLMKMTEQGAATIADAPRRIDEAVDMWKQMGGTMTVFCVTMGEYDYVAVGEAPTDERAAEFALGLARQGNVRTTTLRGFTRDDLASMVGGMPRGGAEEETRRNVKREAPEEETRHNVKFPEPPAPEPPEEEPRRNVKRDAPEEETRRNVRFPEPPAPEPPEPSE
jgi:uncharacterized protein with GYD domain